MASSPMSSTAEPEDEGVNMTVAEVDLQSQPLTASISKGTNSQCNQRPTLSDILANTAPPPWTLSAFMDFLSQSHCLETLEFVLDASRYRKHYTKMINRHPGKPISPVSEEYAYVLILWRRLIDAYIRKSSPREVNLPTDVRDPLLNLSDPSVPPHPSSLDEAVCKTHELMEESVLVRFLNSTSSEIANSAARTQENHDSNTSRSSTQSHDARALNQSRSQTHQSFSHQRASAPSSLTSRFMHVRRFHDAPSTSSPSIFGPPSYASESDALTEGSDSKELPSLANVTRDSWKRVSSKLWPKKRSGSHLREIEPPQNEIDKGEKALINKERGELERLNEEEKDVKVREEGEKQGHLKHEAGEAEAADEAMIEADVAKASFKLDSLHVSSNSLPLDTQLALNARLAANLDNGQSESYKQALETMETASIEQEEDLIPDLILPSFEIVDPTDSPLDNMRAMLDSKARSGGKVFPETRLEDAEELREGSSKQQKNQEDNENDNNSVISSYAASIFSIQSIASSATDLAKGSGYSVDEITTATEDLISMFQNNVDLAPLYLTAIKDPSIGPQRLQRNLRRMFKQYAEHLKTEAKDRLEFLASRLVSLKAGSLSQAIIESYTGITTKTQHEKPHKVRVEEDPDDEWEEEDEMMSVDDTDFEDLIAFREFLLGSSAFQTLRTQIQNFVLPKPSRTTRQEIAIEEDKNRVNLEKEDLEPAEINTARILGRMMQTLNAFLIATGYLEPPLEPAMVRIRWKCRCGEKFTSDIREYEAGGGSHLVAYVEKLTGSQVTLTPYSANSTNQRYIYQQPGLWLRKAFKRLVATFERPSKQCTLPQHSPNATAIHSTEYVNQQQQKMVFLLACVHSGHYGKSLHQDCIDTIDTDRKLFWFLRQQFTRCRGRFCTILSLKAVKNIYFIKFNLFVGGSVEVRHHSHCCENTCECIPPQSRVEPSPQAEYRCKPAGPLKNGPPILPDMLSHYFARPSCISEQDNSILNRLPKHIGGQLQGKIGEPAEGWGIYYQEGWDGDLIMFVTFMIFLVGSFLFGILWSYFKLDIQGAFGVSAYIMTAGALFITLIAMKAGKI